MKKTSLTSQAFRSIRIISKKAQALMQSKEAPIQTATRKPVSATKANPAVITIQVGTVIQATLAILLLAVGAWLFFVLRQKIILLAIAMFVATLVDPGVNFLEKYRIPRSAAILLHYLIAAFVILLSVVQIVPLIASQIQQIAVDLSQSIEPFLQNPQISIPFVAEGSATHAQINRFIATIVQNSSIDTLTQSLQQGASNFIDISELVRFITRVAGSVGRFFASLTVVLVLAFFMQMEKEKMIKWLRGFLPLRYRKYADDKTEAAHTKIGQWMRGQLTLMGSIFTLTFIVLNIVGMPYALTLALFAGLCEFVPAVGPLFAAIPAVIIAGTEKGFIWAVVVALLYWAIQWCENNLLVPIIMRRAVGLSPIAILLAMMVGISFPGTIHPVLGVMLAVPTTTIIAIFLNDWRERNR